MRACARARLLPAAPGIAYDGHTKRIFVTGKLWPRIFEIVAVPVQATPQLLQDVRTHCWPPEHGFGM